MDTIVMGIAITGLGLALIIGAAEAFKRWLSYKEAELAARGTSTENRALEARIQVLERIVTDRGLDVAAQIEALRDSKDHGAGVPLSFEKERA